MHDPNVRRRRGPLLAARPLGSGKPGRPLWAWRTWIALRACRSGGARVALRSLAATGQRRYQRDGKYEMMHCTHGAFLLVRWTLGACNRKLHNAFSSMELRQGAEPVPVLHTGGCESVWLRLALRESFAISPSACRSWRANSR